MDQPSVPRALALCRLHDLRFDLMETSFIVGREKLRRAKHSTLKWRQRLFVLLYNNMLGATLGNLDLLARGVRRSLVNHRGLPHKSARVELQCMIEQTPDPDSRITLGDRKDRLGMPIIRIDWRISTMSSAPSVALMALPLPPARLAPPTTADAIT